MDSEPSNILLQVFFILVLIMFNAFFAASELAVISLNRSKLAMQANEGNKKAKLLLKLLEEPSKFLATIQVGITLAGFLASASAAVTISKSLSNVIKALNIAFISDASEGIAIVIVTIGISFITLVLGELLPKRLALQYKESIAMSVVKPIMFLSKVTLPFVKILTGSTNLFARIFNADKDITDEKVTEEEIRMMINVGEENGVLNETEKEMIDGIFEFDNTLAKEVMTPRTNVFAIDINSPLDEIINEILEEQYSRIPVYEDETDNIIGILYIKDIFILLGRNKIKETNLRDLLRPAYFVPETKNIDILFRELQKSKNHLAILIDEYGGFSGIVTIEDLIEEVMGNIFDEYDDAFEADEDITKIDDNTYIINGLVGISEINDMLHLHLPSEHFDTLGGFVIDLLGSIPKEDEEHVVEYENLVFKVEKVDEKRVEKIKLYIQEQQ